METALTDAASRLVKLCKNWESNIGFMTVDFDDESAAQMLEIMKYFKRYDEDVFVENVSELKIEIKKHFRSHIKPYERD